MARTYRYAGDVATEQVAEYLMNTNVHGWHRGAFFFWSTSTTHNVVTPRVVPAEELAADLAATATANELAVRASEASVAAEIAVAAADALAAEASAAVAAKLAADAESKSTAAAKSTSTTETETTTSPGKDEDASLAHDGLVKEKAEAMLLANGGAAKNGKFLFRCRSGDTLSYVVPSPTFFLFCMI